MTSLVLGTVGGAIGGVIAGPIGAQIGYLVGSLVGNLIDPPKVQGPRLGDTKLQRSAYGQMIPYAWGHGRIGCNVIDQTDLVEHEHKSGGKGGPEVTTYTYSASWLAALCVRLPNREAAIVGITHLFMDGRLVWSSEDGGDCPCVVYPGNETQEPDPTFEAIHGVGNQPAYRGMAYLSFTDFDLTDYGNRIPQVEAVIYTKGGDIPWRVSEFDPWPDTAHSVVSQAIYEGGKVKTLIGEGTNDPNYWYREFNIPGEDQGNASTGVLSGYRVLRSTGNLLNYSVVDHNSGIDYYWTVWNSELRGMEIGVTNPLAQTAGSKTNGNPNAYQNGAIYTQAGVSGGVTHIGKYAAPGGVATGSFAASAALDNAYSEASVRTGTSNDGHIYIGVNQSSPAGVKMWKFDEDLNPVHFWDITDTAGTRLDFSSGGPFYVYQSPTLGVTLVVHEFLSGGIWYIGLVKINADNTLENYGGTLQHTRNGMIHLRGGLLLDQDGVFSLDPPAESESLADVVSDISSLTPAQSVNVAELEDDDVRWYVIGSEMTARNAIEKLRPAYFFDAVEEDYAIVFRKRGDRTVYEIDEDDLVPYEGTGDLLRTIRKREQELPRTVTMTYIDVDMDWQTGSQSSPRQVTQSQYDVTLEIPIGFTATEAARICWTVQCAEWNERESFQFQTTRRWAYITPCTLVKVRGRIIRVQKTTEQPDGEIAYEGVLAAPSLYTQTATGSSSGGAVTQTPTAERVGTELVLLDMPVISQHDAPFGFYAAMGPASDGPWPGATLFKSLDGGTTWNAVASANSAAVIGTTADFPSPSYSGELAPYAGGDAVDESSLCVVLHDVDAELESCTAYALERGANLCAISRGYTGGSPNSLQWEICQFRDAVLIDTNTYLLTGFKRGRMETSTDDHAVGDTFVLLPVTNVDAPVEELNVALLYKAVTFGRTLSTATAVPFENTGQSTNSFYETEAGHMPIFVNVQTGTTYELVKGDRFRLVTFNNASGVAITLPDGMPDGWNCQLENVGTGDSVLTPDTWTIDDGATSLTLSTNQGIVLTSDGSQWWTQRGMGSGGGGGAPVNATYVTLSLNGTLTNERVLTGSANIDIDDGGANGNVTLDLTDTGVVADTYGDSITVPFITVDAKGRITDATNVPIVGQIQTLDEGSSVDTNAIALNFVGDGVTATDAGFGITTVAISALKTYQATATENLTAGDLVNLYTSSGLKVRRADADAVGREVWGYVIASVTSGNTATVYVQPSFLSGLSGLTAGAVYYLSTSAGGITATRPTGAGNIVQIVGMGMSTTELLFFPRAATYNPVTVAYGASVTIDLSGYKTSPIVFDLTLTGACALGFTGGADGQITVVRVKQDGTGGYGLTLDSSVVFGTDIPSFSNTKAANKCDEIAVRYESVSGKYRFISYTRGF